ncbi:MAG: ammonium transporter [Candidatus Eutrophobiaceae bacterium]
MPFYTISKRLICALGGIVLLIPLPAFAGGEINSADTAWLLTATALVLFMTLPGLALFYGGLVRSKNVLSVLMQCFAIACISSILWMFVAYGLAFGNGGELNAVIGGGKLFLSGMGWDSVSGTLPEPLFFMFQMTFAIITPALIIGSFAERMKFSAVLLFSAAWLVLVYAPICHWVWGGGWLADLGFMDFAGGAVVHVNAGIGALVAAIFIGRRKGFPGTPMPPHNMTMTVIGASMLWVGWFGFNAGSALSAGQGAAMAMVATHLSAAAGSLSWMACEWLRHGKPSVLGIVTGMVAGLGAVTPAAGYIAPIGGLLIGLFSGVVCYFSTQWMRRGLKIDDSLDVFPVHGVGGIMGTILTAVFALEFWGGAGLGDNAFGTQIGVQAIGVLATAAWSGIISYVLLKILDRAIGIRVDAEEENEGLDLISHDERAYIL